ncbi:hypothetical protein FB451DRAFT_1557030 [Mycena latifolia]|nr:hypothetical protein FB451DRAFT_1557030 [Mycena latifolia]
MQPSNETDAAPNDTDAALFRSHQLKTEAQLAENATLLRTIRAEIDAVQGRLHILEEEAETLHEAAVAAGLGVRGPAAPTQELTETVRALRKEAMLLERVRARLRNKDPANDKREADLQMLDARSDAVTQRIQALDRIATPDIGTKEAGDLRRKIQNIWWLRGVADNQRKTLSARVKALERATAALRDPITAEAFRASPIRRVPADVLLGICMQATPQDPELVGRGVVPVMTHVCAQWRTWVCEHAVLWSSFACALHDPAAKLNLIKTYLQRAKGMPLTIVLKKEPQDLRLGATNDLPGLAVLETLIAYSAQVYSLRLTGSVWSSAALHGFHGRLPHLEVLQVPFLRLECLREFQTAPLLHTLILDSHCWSDDDYTVIPSAQIRAVHLQDGGEPVGLTNFANLTSLTCTLQRTPSGAPSTNAHAVLPRLLRWRVNFRDKATARDFFAHFTAPALESLELTGPPLAGATQLAAFLERSQCPLSRFVLRTWVPVADLLQICAHAPRLAHLAVLNAPVLTGITDRLLRSLTGATLLPELASLVIEGTYLFRDACLVAMLESRTGASLRVVQLVLPDRVVQNADVRRLRGLEGVHVSLQCQDGQGQLVRAL